MSERIAELKVRKVSRLPERLAPGVLYYVPEYEFAVRLCECGCSARTAVPLGGPDWEITHEEEDLLALYPSIEEFQTAVRSGKRIQAGRVVWC
jgi:hypothetical protein